MFRVPSSDGVEVAVHEFGGAPDAPPLLLSHATGFHAHCYEPAAARLAEHFRVYALDYRGHGSTAAPVGWRVEWARFGDDALNVARAIAPRGGLVGVGHSMGGAALLMAAHRDRERFDQLVLFEPIAIPDDTPDAIPDDTPDDTPDGTPDGTPDVTARVPMDDHPIVVGARRRRQVFDSFEDAIENYRDKLPLSVMTPEVLRAYVEHGFRPLIDDDGNDVGVEIICTSEIEAGIFMSSRDNGVWGLLPEITTPTTVVTGYIDEQQPSGRCADIAARLPVSSYVFIPHQSHLGPFSHPAEFADLVLAELGSHPSRTP
jgi:pimeloyl-ACP methyl ester carboxylesterase